MLRFCDFFYLFIYLFFVNFIVPFQEICLGLKAILIHHIHTANGLEAALIHNILYI